MTSENAIYTPAQGRLLEALLKAPARRVHNSGRLGDYTWWINGNAVTGQLHRAMLKGLVRTHAGDPDTAVIPAAGRAALAAPLALRSQGSSHLNALYARSGHDRATGARQRRWRKPWALPLFPERGRRPPLFERTAERRPKPPFIWV